MGARFIHDPRENHRLPGFGLDPARERRRTFRTQVVADALFLRATPTSLTPNGSSSVPKREAPFSAAPPRSSRNIALRDGEDAGIDDAVMDEFHWYADRDRGVASGSPPDSPPHPFPSDVRGPRRSFMWRESGCVFLTPRGRVVRDSGPDASRRKRFEPLYLSIPCGSLSWRRLFSLPAACSVVQASTSRTDGNVSNEERSVSLNPSRIRSMWRVLSRYAASAPSVSPVLSRIRPMRAWRR